MPRRKFIYMTQICWLSCWIENSFFSCPRRHPRRRHSFRHTTIVCTCLFFLLVSLIFAIGTVTSMYSALFLLQLNLYHFYGKIRFHSLALRSNAWIFHDRAKKKYVAGLLNMYIIFYLLDTKHIFCPSFRCILRFLFRYKSGTITSRRKFCERARSLPNLSP